jgi:hypothetical protein
MINKDGKQNHHGDNHHVTQHRPLKTLQVGGQPKLVDGETESQQTDDLPTEDGVFGEFFFKLELVQKTGKRNYVKNMADQERDQS